MEIETLAMSLSLSPKQRGPQHAISATHWGANIRVICCRAEPAVQSREHVACCIEYCPRCRAKTAEHQRACCTLVHQTVHAAH